MNFLKSKWGKRLSFYSALILVTLFALYLYNNDSQAPKLGDLTIGDPSYSADARRVEFPFSGSITDARGIASAEIHCVQDGQTKFFIYLELFGSSKYFVSFGEKSGSFSWMGSWDGTATDLKFKGTARLVDVSEQIECNWESRLKDTLGNYAVTPLGISTTIKSN